jgi:predicted metal-dependent enzyme (double-stranded beta helix superfamily)
MFETRAAGTSTIKAPAAPDVARVRRGDAMFDVDRFVVDCRNAAATNGLPAVLDVVAGAVSTPGAILQALGEPRSAGAHVLHRSPELTVFNLIWGPRMCQLPHNHGMWAVIGIYRGREDNIFWRRAADARGTRIETAGGKALSEREAVALEREVIHSVVNPIKRLTGAIHVYGGDFYAVQHGSRRLENGFP